jgi:hypothetical protein
MLIDPNLLKSENNVCIAWRICAKNDAMLKKCRLCRWRFSRQLVLVPIINRNKSSKAQKDMKANLKET